MAVKIYSLFLLIFIMSCISCDMHISLQRDNFAWSQKSFNVFNRHFDAYYWNHANRYWVVLCWKGKGLIQHHENYALLCLNKIMDGTLPTYEMHHGIVIYTVALKNQPGIITRLRLMNNEYFNTEDKKGRPEVLRYNGSVSGKSSYGALPNETVPQDMTFDTGQDMTWLKFEVKPKKNCDKINAIIKQLMPLLQKEDNTEKIIGSFNDLLEGSVK